MSREELRQEILQEYNPPQCGDGRCRDGFMEFIYWAVLPCGVMLLIVIILSWILCCKASKCRKSKAQEPTNDVELETYNTIRRASANLRHMSQCRDSALMGSRAGSMTLDRVGRRTPRNRDSCYSAPGTLQRQHRQRHLERENLARESSPFDQQSARDSIGRSPRNRYSDQPSAPPPPPPYTSVTDDSLIGAEVLLKEKRQDSPAVRYDTSTGAGLDSDGSGHPLLAADRTYH